ncbi:MAG: hypothetical protein BWK79_04745 [Beggiatoa sp. IS2]|nr:MAG: hypothetical protein BWK79_04745 [Beggiatoa sp. IS2]
MNKLHYDHFFTIGKTHLVCEDYATQGDKPMPFIVLCDGCSSSKDSDIGARILALATKHIVENAAEWPMDYAPFGQKLILTALDIVEKMHLTTNVLDATVMLAFVQQEAIQVYVYGDGCLFFKDLEGNVGTIEIIFTHNAPFYLSYWPDKARQEEYADYEPKPLLLKDSVNGLSEPLPFQKPLVFSLPLAKFPVVAIASDGAAHFIDATQTAKVPLFNIANSLLDFKNVEGEFVKRRSKRALEQYAQRNIFPADDLSVGVFVQSVEDT